MLSAPRAQEVWTTSRGEVLMTGMGETLWEMLEESDTIT